MTVYVKLGKEAAVYLAGPEGFACVSIGLQCLGVFWLFVSTASTSQDFLPQKLPGCAAVYTFGWHGEALELLGWNIKKLSYQPLLSIIFVV